MKKREQWRLPPTFKPKPVKDGAQQRHDGEPRFYELKKFENDRTLHTDVFNACCDCGLKHHYTYNVLKTPDGTWYLVSRAYRVPGTGKNK